MSASSRCLTSPEEYEALQAEFARGEARVSISREVARQFYLVTSLAEIRRRTGRFELLAKLTVLAGALLTPALALLCLAQIVWFHGWWAAVVLPIAGILWTVIAGLLNPVGPWWTVTLAFAGAVVVYPTGLLPVDVATPLIPWVASLWVNRMTYLAAEQFLARLVIASRPAFEMLCDHIEVRRLAPEPA